MEPARKQQFWSATEDEYQADAKETGHEVPEWQITLGKTIFYLTCALSIWFFYWLNGINCPC